MNYNDLIQQPLKQLLADYPWLEDFFSSFGLQLSATEQSLCSYLESLDPDQLLDLGISQEQLGQSLHDFIAGMLSLEEEAEKVESLTIIGGYDKTGKAEALELTLQPGQVICIVGPTGSGKSRLLADIEWVAQGDTPTKRKVLINGKTPDNKWRFSTEHKLVAQLSQNMNFVMDLTALVFVLLAKHDHHDTIHRPDALGAPVDNILCRVVGQHRVQQPCVLLGHRRGL